MKVFITSASGYVGTEVAKLLLADGHTVAGLARSDKSAEVLRAAGIGVVRGNLEDLASLAKGAEAADAVIHTAFVHSGATYDEAVEVDVKATNAIINALAGTDKVFITTSGTGFMGDTANVEVTEEFPFDYTSHAASRTKGERITLLASGKGVRGIVLRLPPYVWGLGGSFFIPVQLEAAKRLGTAYYALPGTQQLPSAHVTDIAKLYILALQDGTPGLYNAATSSASTLKEIAEAVGENAGVPAKGVAREELFKKEIWPGWVTGIITSNHRVSSQKAREKLGWTKYEEVTMLHDVAHGSYKTSAH